MYFSKQEIGQTKLSIMWSILWSILWSKLRVLTGMLVLTLILFNGQVIPAEAAVFKDLEGHWAAKDVESLWAQDIISADASGLFYPDKKVTRAELVSMLVRALAHEEEKANSADVEGLGQVSFLRTSSTLPVINKPFFKDVLPGKWYFPYIQSAYQ
ncbi:MAG: S-layer homology domain-containing protein, partial [Carboxydocellales bacterium]